MRLKPNLVEKLVKVLNGDYDMTTRRQSKNVEDRRGQKMDRDELTALIEQLNRPRERRSKSADPVKMREIMEDLSRKSKAWR